MKTRVFLPVWVNVAAASCLRAPFRRYGSGRGLRQLFHLGASWLKLELDVLVIAWSQTPPPRPWFIRTVHVSVSPTRWYFAEG